MGKIQLNLTLFVMVVTIIMRRLAGNQSLTLKRATAAWTNSLLVERNLEQDRLIWEGLPADGRPVERKGEMEGGRNEGGKRYAMAMVLFA